VGKFHILQPVKLYQQAVPIPSNWLLLMTKIKGFFEKKFAALDSLENCK